MQELRLKEAMQDPFPSYDQLPPEAADRRESQRPRAQHPSMQVYMNQV